MDIVLPSYAIVNSRLTWKDVMGTKLTAALYAKNIFDKQYCADGLADDNFPDANVVSAERLREGGWRLASSFRAVARCRRSQ